MRRSSPRSYMSRTFPEERRGRSATAVTLSRLAIVEVAKQRADALDRVLRALHFEAGVSEPLERAQLAARLGRRGRCAQALGGVVKTLRHRVGPVLHGPENACKAGRVPKRWRRGDRRGRRRGAGN